MAAERFEHGGKQQSIINIICRWDEGRHPRDGTLSCARVAAASDLSLMTDSSPDIHEMRQDGNTWDRRMEGTNAGWLPMMGHGVWQTDRQQLPQTSKASFLYAFFTLLALFETGSRRQNRREQAGQEETSLAHTPHPSYHGMPTIAFCRHDMHTPAHTCCMKNGRQAPFSTNSRTSTAKTTPPYPKQA